MKTLLALVMACLSLLIILGHTKNKSEVYIVDIGVNVLDTMRSLAFSMLAEKYELIEISL